MKPQSAPSDFSPSGHSQRLDSSVSALYQQQLVHISPQAFDVKRLPLMSRILIPKIEGVDQFAEVYKFRGHEFVGKATAKSAKANAPSRADVISHEAFQKIITRWSSFAYSEEELGSAARAGVPIDAYKMKAAVMAVEKLVDQDLSLGDALYDIKGILRLTGTTTSTLSAKTGGGGTNSWSLTVGTPDEIAADVMGLLNAIAVATDDDQVKFRVVLPRAKLQILRQRRMGDGIGLTILQFLKDNCDNMLEILPWSRTLLAGGNLDATRMAAFPNDATYVGALVPREPSLGNKIESISETEQAVKARVGGVVAHYPQYVGYLDGI